MSWLNPVAFVGLLALAVPILVHLFGRRVAKRQRFPSLRLLRDAKPTPATRSRPSDVLLLVLRCLTIAAAVAALAQPRWSNAGRATDPVRVVVVDTSLSMRRLTSEGTTAAQQARAIAERMADSSSEALVVETDRPGRALVGAGSWLSRRGGMREVVVVSDFQAGAIEEGDLALSEGLGIRLVRVNAASAIASVDSANGVITEATPEGTNATWISSGGDTTSSIRILAAEADRQAVQRSVDAAHAVASSNTTRSVAVVFPSAPTRRDLSAQVIPLDSAWQGDLLLALERDPVLASVAPSATAMKACETPGTVVSQNGLDEPIASIGVSPQGLAMFTCVEPGSLAATAMIAGIETALGTRPSMHEREPTFLPDETLRRWERPSIESAPRGPGETSPDGRWLWVIALVFLVAEEFARRRTPGRSAESASEVRNERVA